MSRLDRLHPYQHNTIYIWTSEICVCEMCRRVSRSVNRERESEGGKWCGGVIVI